MRTSLPGLAFAILLSFCLGCVTSADDSSNPRPNGAAANGPANYQHPIPILRIRADRDPSIFVPRRMPTVEQLDMEPFRQRIRQNMGGILKAGPVLGQIRRGLLRIPLE